MVDCAATGVARDETVKSPERQKRAPDRHSTRLSTTNYIDPASAWAKLYSRIPSEAFYFKLPCIKKS
ncbi:MAG: hypothetical protein BGO56_06670 [Sphingobacteriales bacterium 48-107]|nr:MAG: hypothetical protein BGO56_06670 [Sphingobacteriales bacterium 48-107]